MAFERNRPDGYVQMLASELSAVELRHLVSEKDSSIAVPDSASSVTITGITEWVGAWHDETVSVGWDWGVLEGVVVVLSRKEIRTNIQLMSQNHRPAAAAIAQTHFLRWIDSIPWSEVAIIDLL